MSYLKALEERKIRKTDLPKAVQKKIEKLDGFLSKIQLYEVIKDLDEEEKAQLDYLKKNIKVLDKEIEKAVKRFDPDIYAKKLEQIEQMREKRNQKSGTKVVKEKAKPKEEEKPEVKEEEADFTGYFPPEEVINDVSEEIEEFEVPPVSKRFDEEEIKREIERLKKEAEIRSESFETETEAAPEVEEFEKVGDAKPRKLSKGVMLMGIGMFFLTWGAVNFFRERRG